MSLYINDEMRMVFPSLMDPLRGLVWSLLHPVSPLLQAARTPIGTTSTIAGRIELSVATDSRQNHERHKTSLDDVCLIQPLGPRHCLKGKKAPKEMTYNS